MNNTERLASLEQQLQAVQEEIASVRENLEKEKKQPEKEQPKRKIELTNLPVDTPVRVWDSNNKVWAPRHFADPMRTFNNGTSSSTTAGALSFWAHMRINFDACKPTLWLGGQQPVPDGVQVRVWLRDGTVGEANASAFKWIHNSVEYDKCAQIIGYQMIGIAEGYEE